jgi:hypothetical protein
LLGNGYRAYNPTLMRFHSPDSWSPFGGGGLNAYTYCVGDPVNFSDPTGHRGVGKFFSRALDFFFGGAEVTGPKGIARRSSDLGPMRPEKTGELKALTTLGSVTASAPGPRGNSSPRMTSVAPENLSRPGYVEGAAASGLTARGNRPTRSPSSSPNLQAGTSRPSNQRQGMYRNSTGEIVVTRRNSSGQMITGSREQVRGGGDGARIHPRTRMHEIRTQPAFVNELADTRRDALIRAMNIRNEQLRQAGLPERGIRIAMRREVPGMLRRIDADIQW